MRTLPIINLEIDGELRSYYVDTRLKEYRSIDGCIPWIIPAAEAITLISWETGGREL